MGNKISKYFYIKSYTENKEVKIQKKRRRNLTFF